MRVNHKFFGSSFVKIFITVRSLIQGDGLYIYGFCNLYFIVQNCLHVLPVIPHHRALPCMEGMGFGPAQTDPDHQVSFFGFFASRLPRRLLPLDI